MRRTVYRVKITDLETLKASIRAQQQL
jgi:hypothetical protein